MKLQHLFESYRDAKRKFVKQGATKEEATSYVHTFKQLQQRLKGQEKDISHWIRQGWLPFKNFVDSQQQDVFRKQQLKAVKEKGAVKLLDTNEISIILPLNPESACKYGANTKWCIASRLNHDPGNIDYYFDIFDHDFMDYTFEGRHIYIVNFKIDLSKRNLEAPTQNIQNKMAFEIDYNEIQFYDEKDNDLLWDDGEEILKEFNISIKDLITIDRKLKPYIQKYRNAYMEGVVNRIIDVVDFDNIDLENLLANISGAGPFGEGTQFMTGKRLYNLEKKILENPKIYLEELFNHYYDDWLSPKNSELFIRDWVKGGLVVKLVYINYLAGDTEYFYRNVGYLSSDVWPDIYGLGKWPEAEQVFKLDAQSAIEYAYHGIKGRWYEAEPMILEEPRFILDYYDQVILEHELFKRGGDPIWIEALEKYPNKLLSRYLEDLLDYGERNEELEPYVKRLTGVQGFLTMSSYYDRHIIEGDHEPERWPELEEKFRRLRKDLPKETLEEVLNYAAHNNFTKWKALWDQINSPKLKISKTGRKRLQSKYKRLIGDPPK